MSELREAVASRRSYSRVTDDAPSHEELLTLVEAASRVADHASLKPWRLIELRGTVRETLGSAIAKVEGLSGSDAERLAAKPLRAPLLIAVVARHQPSEKVPRWEQSAVASGVAHVLSLLLNDAGWGVIWRTGHYVRAKKIAELHGLAKNERLLGWLYVGGIPDETKPGRKQPIEAGEFLTVLEP